MTSRSFFDSIKCIMKEDISHRLYLPALSILTAFFSYPVVTLLMIGKAEENARYQLGYEADPAGVIRKQIFSALKEMYMLRFDTMLLIFLGLVAAILGFSYLMRANRSDFYHSLPFRRSVLYTAVALDGFIMVMVPCLIFAISAGVIVSVRTGSVWPVSFMLERFAANVPCFLICYSFAILAVMLTGHPFTALLASMTFYLYSIWLGFVATGLHSIYYKTFYSGDMAEIMNSFDIFSPLSLSMSESLSLCGSPVLTRIVCIAIAALVFFISYRLYAIRPVERAGSSLIFDKVKFPVKFLLVVPAALSGALLMCGVTDDTSWEFFGFVCALVIGHCIMEIIYSADFRKLFAHKREFLICFAVALAILLTFKLDLTGFDRYIPGEGKLAGAGITSFDVEQNMWMLQSTYHLEESEFDSDKKVVEDYFDQDIYMDKANYTDVAVIRELAQKAVDYSLSVKEDEAYEIEGVHAGDLVVSYHLSNGKTVHREYIVDLQEVGPLLDRLHDSPEYKRDTYPVLSMDPSELCSVRYQDVTGYHELDCTRAQMERLLSEYCSELGALTMEKRRHEDPVACIQFTNRSLIEIMDYMKQQGQYYEYILDYGFYPVYPSFTGTLALLNECGVDPADELAPSKFAKINLSISRDDELYGDTYAAEGETGDGYDENAGFADENSVDGEYADEYNTDGEYADGYYADEEEGSYEEAGSNGKRVASDGALKRNYLEITEPDRIAELLSACSPMLDYTNNAYPGVYIISPEAVYTDEAAKELMSRPDSTRIIRTVNLNVKRALLPEFVISNLDISPDELENGTDWHF